MKYLSLCIIILAVTSSCGVKKLTPAGGFYFKNSERTQHSHTTNESDALAYQIVLLASESKEVGSDHMEASDVQPDGLEKSNLDESSDEAEERTAVRKEKVDLIHTPPVPATNENAMKQITAQQLIVAERNSKSKSVSDWDVDWEVLGQIGFYLLLALLFGLAYFGHGGWAIAASVIIAIGYTILLIAAVVLICYFFYIIFFGWMEYL